MNPLEIIGSIIAYIVILVLTLMVIHYAFGRVRSAFKSVFKR
jgi:uncharacterized membrane protein